jgi:hypothetical protein
VNGVTDAGGAVGGEIIHHHDVAGPQRRHQNLLGRLKALASSKITRLNGRHQIYSPATWQMIIDMNCLRK